MPCCATLTIPMVEDQLLGKVCWCIPTRIFVSSVAATWVLVAVGKVCSFLISFPFEPSDTRPCSGHHCREVFTCIGMQATTYHIRVPWLMIGALVFGTFGWYGASHSSAYYVRLWGLYLWCSGWLYVALLIADALFMRVCDAYPVNVIQQLLQWPVRSMLMSEAQKDVLSTTQVFPRTGVDTVLGYAFFNWNFLYMIVVTLILFWLSYKALMVAMHYIDGPVGLGVNYRVGTWRGNILAKESMLHMLNKDAESTRNFRPPPEKAYGAADQRMMNEANTAHV